MVYRFKRLKYVYITNGITEAIHTTMIEHSLRPIVQKNEYPALYGTRKSF